MVSPLLSSDVSLQFDNAKLGGQEWGETVLSFFAEERPKMPAKFRIIAFYSVTETDTQGLSSLGIQEWPDEQLESVHDFVQRLRAAEGSTCHSPAIKTVWRWRFTIS